MNKRLKNIGTKAISIALSASMLATSTLTAMAANNTITEYSFDQLKCVMYSGGADLLLNEDTANVQGDIYTDGDLKFTGNADELSVIGYTLKGSNSEKCEMNNYVDVINSSVEYNFIYDENKEISSSDIDLNVASMYNSDKIILDDVSINGKGIITSKQDIVIDMRSDKTVDQEAIIMSENGDVTLDCAKLTFNGLIYAPKGKVTINSKDISYVGAIYANEIEINGTKLNMEYKDFLPDELVCDAGDDKTTYLEDGVQLSSSCNYSNAEISYSVSDEQKDMVSFANGNTLKPTLTFTEAGEFTVTMTAKLNNTTSTDTVKVIVTPEPVVTYTTTDDFADGTLSNIVNDNDELKLGIGAAENTPYTVSYNEKTARGVSITSQQSKTMLSSESDKLDITYNLNGYGKAEESTGNDMVLLVDNSGSMSSKLNILKESALKILEYMGPNDRFGLSDLGRVHHELSNDKEALTKAIEKCTSGSGSSDYIDGVESALPMFEQSGNDRNKYILLLADGEWGIQSLDTAARLASKKNVRVIAFQLNDINVAFNSNYGYAMQEMAAATKGYYKISLDPNEISESMLQFADEVYNIAGNDVTLTTTVVNKAYLDTADVENAPSSIVYNDDGSATVSWKYKSIDIGATEKITLPLKTELITQDGYYVIAKNTKLTYYDKSGNGTVVNLEDTLVGKNDYASSGKWASTVYDSGKNDCTWSLVNWNAEYNGTSSIDVYLSVSNDGKNFGEPIKVSNNQSLQGVRGRYIKTEVEMNMSVDGSTPVLYDLTIYADDNKQPEISEKVDSLAIYSSGNPRVGSPLAIWLDTKGYGENAKTITFDITDKEGNVVDEIIEVKNQNELLKYVTFNEIGEYVIKASVTNINGTKTNARLNLKVEKRETINKATDSNINTSIEMTVEGIPEVVRANDTINLSISYNEPEQIVWSRVYYYTENHFANVSVRRAAYVYEGSKNTASFVANTTSNNNLVVVVQAFDKYGSYAEYKKTVFVDNQAPVISLSGISTKYCGQDLTVKVTASDNYGIDNVVFMIDDQAVELDENGEYTFTKTEPTRCKLVAIATDKVGLTKTVENTVNFIEDTVKPSCNLRSVGSLYLGNSTDIVLEAYDYQTGLKSYEVTLNGEKITMTPGENNRYTYKFKPEAIGEYVFNAIVTDNRGNQSTSTIKCMCIADTNRPSVNIRLSNNQVIAGDDITIEVTANDNVAVTDLKFYIDDIEQQLSEDNTFVYHSDDTNLDINGKKNVNFKVVAKDNAGNEGIGNARLIVIKEDTELPNINLSCYPQMNIYSNSNMTVRASDNIAVKELKVYVNGKEVELDDNDRYYFDTSDFFQYDIKAVATDTSGNTREVTYKTVVVDSTRPNIRVSKNKGSYTMGDTAEFTVEITDNYKLDLSTITANFDGVTLDVSGDKFVCKIENLTAGSHNFVVSCADTSRNVSTSTTTINVADTQAPTVSINTDKEKYAAGEQPIINYTITDNYAIKAVEAYINETPLEYVDGELKLPVSFEPGEYTISIKATDNAGNVSEASCSFTILKSTDVTCPVINGVTYSPTQWQVGTPVFIKVDATDDSGDVTVTITANGTSLSYDSMNEQFEFNPTEAGNVNFKVKAEDAAGNYVTGEFTKYVYDNLDGHKLVVNAEKVVKVGEETTVTLSSSDNYPFVKTSLRCDTTGKEITCDAANSNVYKFILDTAGEYTFTATGIDEQGLTDTQVFTITSASSYEADVSSEAMQQYLVDTTETHLTEELLNIKNTFTSPADAYEYVVNNIQYDSYINSRRGAVGAYETGHANDYDQASLLIGFMRNMGYPARYVSGSITLTEDQLLSLFGATDFLSACSMISNSGRKAVKNNTNHTVTIDQVWVEVYVPGSVIGETDPVKKNLGFWIELDASIKPSKLVETAIAQTIPRSIITSQNVLNKYKDTQISSLVNNLSEKDISDNISERIIKQQSFEVLPSKLQYTVKQKNSDFAAVTENMSDTISFYMEDYFDSYTMGTYKSVDLYGKRISVQYTGNTGNATIFELGSSAVANNIFRPALTIDGKIVSYGPETTLGNSQNLQFTVKSGGNTTTFEDELIAGSMYSVILDTGYVSEQTYNNMFDTATIENPMEENDKAPTAQNYYDEEKLGTYLAYVGNAYFMYCDAQNIICAAMKNIEKGNQLKVAVTGYNIQTEVNMMNQYTKVLPGNFFIDVDMNNVYATSRTGDQEARNSFMLSSGAVESFYEGYIWEMMLCVESVSTMSVLFEAGKQGIDIIPIFAGNYDTVINTITASSSVKNEIRNAVNQGYSVLIPKTEITIGEWKGTGYIIGDFKDYSHFVFKISGGINGGSTSIPSDLGDQIKCFLTEEFFDQIGADYDEFYCNTFTICQSMYHMLLIKEIASLYGSCAMDIYIGLGKEAFNKLIDDDFFEETTSLITIMDYYVDMLDSILSYAEDSITGVQEITEVMINMICDLFGVETDDVGRCVQVILGIAYGDSQAVSDGYFSAFEATMKNLIGVAAGG